MTDTHEEEIGLSMPVPFGSDNTRVRNFMREERQAKNLRRKLRVGEFQGEITDTTVTIDSGLKGNVPLSDHYEHHRGYSAPWEESEARQSDLVRKRFIQTQEQFHRANAYEDNIEGQTEVFYQAESRMSHQTADKSAKYMTLGNHHREIEQILASQFSDVTKQRMIDEIHERFKEMREGQNSAAQPRYRDQMILASSNAPQYSTHTH